MRETFYSDLDIQTAGGIEASLRPHADLVFSSPVPAPAWLGPEFEKRLLFLRCTQDKAMPLHLQDSLIERSGVHWLVKDVEASHSAFVSRPDEIIALLRDFLQT